MDTIVVYDPDGKCVRSFGKEHHGVADTVSTYGRGRRRVLHLSLHPQRSYIAKTLTGEEVCANVPRRVQEVQREESEVCSDEHLLRTGRRALRRRRIARTSFTSTTRDANWVRTPGAEPVKAGKMQTPHGLCAQDDRGDGEADHRRL